MMGSQYIGSEKKFVKCQVSKFPIYLGQIVQGLKRSEARVGIISKRKNFIVIQKYKNGFQMKIIKKTFSISIVEKQSKRDKQFPLSRV